MFKKLLELIPKEQDKLYEEAKKNAQRGAFLSKIIETVGKNCDIYSVLSIICKETRELFNVDRVAIGQYKSLDSNSNNLYAVIESTSDKVVQRHNDVKIPSEVGEYLWKNLFVEKKDVIFNDIKDYRVPDFYREFHIKIGTKSIINTYIGNEKENWGIMALFQNSYYRHWTKEEIQLFHTISSQIYIAIKQAELLRQAEQHAYREALLRRINESIRSSLDIDKIKQSIVTETGKIFDADRCLIRLWEDCPYKNTALEKSAEYLKSKTVKSIADLEPSKEFQNYLMAVFKNKGNIYAPDLDNLPKEQEAINFLKPFDVKSAYACPLYKGDSPIGFLIIQFVDDKVKLNGEDIELLNIVAQQSSLALKQAWLYKRTQIQAKRADFLRKIIETVGGSLDLEFLLNSICKEIFELFKPDRVAIEHYIDNSDYAKWSVTSQYTSGPDILGVNDIEYSAETKEYLGVKTLDEGKDIVADNLEKSSLPDYFIETHKKMKIKSYIAVPLKKDNDKWGVLALSQVHKYRKWTKGEIELLHMVAEQAYIAIRQAGLYAEAQEAVKLKHEFITNMSHEIRTPLNSILGFSQLLNNPECTKEKHQKYLNNVCLSTNHLLELVNSILNFSKLEAGEMFLCLEKFNLAQEIKETVLSIKSMAIQKNINIKTELTEEIIEADPLKFKQIMLNLLSNAIKFTNENGQVTVRTKSKKNLLIIEVEDTGIGISQEDRHKIFKYFTQLDSSPSRNNEGTGLGLVLVKKLVELHNGTIDFESKKGKGTKFWFTLPKTKELKTPVEK